METQLADFFLAIELSSQGAERRKAMETTFFPEAGFDEGRSQGAERRKAMETRRTR